MSEQAACPRSEVLAELERMLASANFAASPRNRRFLRHVVEETIAGRGDRIKAYTIATSVFGRADDFDPVQDSIVRIEAARLRREIEHFYLCQPGHQGLRITIHKGTYIPTFTPPRAIAPECAGRAAPVQNGPCLLVEHLDQVGGRERCPTASRTLTRQIISSLTRFSELFVLGSDPGAGDAPERRRPVDYQISGTLTITDHRMIAEILMKDFETGRYVWARNFERPVLQNSGDARMVELCAEVAGEIAQVIALRDGILDGQVREFGRTSPAQYMRFQKLLDFQDYWRSLDPARFAPLRRDLEAVIIEDPNFADAHACLSLLYSNAARYAYDVSDCGMPPLERAALLARRAIMLAPSSSRAYHAKAVGEWFSGKPDASIATLQTALALNPSDPELMAEMGFRRAMRMEWEVAVPLIEAAYAYNPQQTGQYRMGLFFWHFAQGRHAAALQETHAIDAPGIAVVHIAAAAALSELGRLEDAAKRLAEAERLVPGLQERLEEDLISRHIHTELVILVMAAIARINPSPALGRFGNLGRR